MKILIEMCSKAVENFRSDSVWRTGSVLVFNSTDTAEGFIRERLFIVVGTTILLLSNETHIVVYTTSAGQYPCIPRVSST